MQSECSVTVPLIFRNAYSKKIKTTIVDSTYSPLTLYRLTRTVMPTYNVPLWICSSLTDAVFLLFHHLPFLPSLLLSLQDPADSGGDFPYLNSWHSGGEGV